MTMLPTIVHSYRISHCIFARLIFSRVVYRVFGVAHSNFIAGMVCYRHRVEEKAIVALADSRSAQM